MTEASPPRPTKVDPSVHARARSFTDPLFVQDFFLRTGRSIRTPCATATFVKFEKQIYAVTCRHVVANMSEADPNAQVAVLAFGADAAVLNMANFVRSETDGVRPSVVSLFSSPRYLEAERSTDIAIARMGSAWDFLEGRKRKTFVNLDNWAEPSWPNIKTCAAVGYLTEHKTESDQGISTGMALSTVDVASAVSKDTVSFRLHSRLEEPHGYWMSGMSGGPVLALKSSTEFDVIGIVYEGGPSSPRAQQGLASGPNDLFYGALLLTPSTFADWLSRTELPDLEYSFMAVVH